MDESLQKSKQYHLNIARMCGTGNTEIYDHHALMGISYQNEQIIELLTSINSKINSVNSKIKQPRYSSNELLANDGSLRM